ncbi:queuosine precursor transporter [Aquimarina sp. 2201CG5-10]|uniref:queuosine precursor transporter n=1 Tax=Aquimarina callyspongiae TaxID=3098150 RepID=UPI002AB374D4|nr:queuosine precursor transporter [Aquimarina sp. 2201CG5-10]MDY8136644.1 queuosine precursor transporter [Aquimarina sp. 2201CG5-10]
MNENTLELKDKIAAYRIYIILGALFISSLVVCNLIFQKFFQWDFFGIYTFTISVGLLPYPLTFLITDIISEIYGKKKANLMVTAGIFASIFSLLIIYSASAVNAYIDPGTDPNIQVDNDTFNLVFGKSLISVFASMTAYLFAQYIDIKIFHFWKRVTKGKHLWIRNNFSTFLSQLVDSVTIISLLCLNGIFSWDNFIPFVMSGFLFKVIVATLDTPLLYMTVFFLRKRFKLKHGEELRLEY